MRHLLTFVLLICIAACSRNQPIDVLTGVNSIQPADIMRHTRVLASDAYEGRAPGTAGEESTVKYLAEQFRSLGLEPGNPDGTYVQKVPLVGVTSMPELKLTAGGKPLALSPRQDIVIHSRRFVPEVKIDNTDVIFAGYGVQAPEYGWDDFKDADVKGKTILVLINDPAIPDPADASKLDGKMFKGRAMTYYGRWTYKYEKASEIGAAAVLIVHETGPAGYPFAVVGSQWGRENFEIQRSDGNQGRVPIEGWITDAKAREWLGMCGQDYDQLKKAALQKGFKPVPVKAKASFTVRNQIRNIDSQNVIAKWTGAARKDEYVAFTAHWDHLGRDASLQGDQIFNGAHDNASGVAGLLEIAEAFTKLSSRPDRSILFLAVTAEEKGLLGARYYAENPLYPLTKTLANINMDGLNPWGRTTDYLLIGYGNSTLDDLFTEEAAHQGRVIKPDEEPEKGFFYRSDHFEFAKQGVPASHSDYGVNFVGQPVEYGRKKREEFTAQHYHKVSDDVKEDWTFEGAAEDVRLLFRVGMRVAQGDKWPEWKPGTEFKSRREAMLRNN
jgi:Zn-dependent M28 family amino/carboxypeptidase